MGNFIRRYWWDVLCVLAVFTIVAMVGICLWGKSHDVIILRTDSNGILVPGNMPDGP